MVWCAERGISLSLALFFIALSLNVCLSFIAKSPIEGLLAR